ncbi:MAG: hypothetical protein LBG58_15545 [Planctomycetaceae bacterium]|nr:hypothetical protein [Planctomycetaceae bacterium]
MKFICNYLVEGGRQPFAERLRRLVCCCVVCCWFLLSGCPQGQVGEYADAMAGESPSAKHCLPSSME